MSSPPGQCGRGRKKVKTPQCGRGLGTNTKNAAKLFNQAAGAKVLLPTATPKQVEKALECRNIPGNPANLRNPATCVKNIPLKTSQITSVVSRFSRQYPARRFTFLGTVPLDFQRVFPRVANPALAPDGTYGVIFNTDPSTEAGTHWIAAFIDMPAKVACFFDSLGKKPPAPIEAWIRAICSKFGLTRVYNKSKHQLGNTECGVYCIYFIEQKLAGSSCDAINKSKIHDLDMSALRTGYRI